MLLNNIQGGISRPLGRQGIKKSGYINVEHPIRTYRQTWVVHRVASQIKTEEIGENF